MGQALTSRGADHVEREAEKSFPVQTLGVQSTKFSSIKDDTPITWISKS